METARVKIGRVRFHNGPTLRVFDRDKATTPEGVEFGRSLVSSAGNMAEWWEDMAGYVVICWNSRGRWTVGYRNGANSPFSAVMMPSFVEAALREQGTTNETVNWLNRQNKGDR